MNRRSLQRAGLRAGATLLLLLPAAALLGQVIFQESFDTTQAPALPPGWTSTATDWFTEGTANSDTPPNHAHAFEVAAASDKQLTSPVFVIPTGSRPLLTFRNRFHFPADIIPVTEAADDYGTLEISIAGTPFQDILAAGGAFQAGGYNETFGGTTPVWGGDTGGLYQTVEATLPAAAVGNAVQLRWHMVTTGFGDPATYEGWRIDTIVVASCPPTATASAAAPVICSNSSTTLSGAGGDGCSWTPATWLSDSFSCTPAVIPNGQVGTVVYTLTVTRASCPAGSNTDSAITSVTSDPPPIAAATATRTAICPNGVTTLRGLGGSSCVWTPATGLSNPNICAPTAMPTATTTYSLTVKDACGTSTNSADVTITVTPRPAGPQVSAPLAAFAGQTGLVASIVDPVPGSTFLWFFSPPGAATVTAQGPSSITFTANVAGTLQVSVTENNGTCSSTATVAAIIVSTPCSDPQPPTDPRIQVSGNPDAPVTGIDFLDLSWAPPETPPAFFLWSLNGDPAVETTDAFALDQPPTGSNDPITLSVRSACTQEQVSDPAEVTVSPTPPVAQFSVDSPVDAGEAVTFTDTSDPGATSWLWLFGDGSDPATDQSVIHSFVTEGTYTVFLIASNGAGASSASQTIVVQAASGASPAVSVVSESRVFDASNRERQRLNGVTLTGSAPRWLHILSPSPSQPPGARETIVFLRFLDATGALVRERRLSVSAGREAVFDLNAYGLRGVYDLELVSLRPITASVIGARARQPRAVRRPGR